VRRLAAALALTLASCQTPAVSTPQHVGPSRVANLHAFARLYGVVRWFHPSDAAAAIDWDRFAIDGAHRVVDAPDARALRAALTELFAPIAPTVTIAGPGEQLADDPSLHPAQTAGLDVVAWEHVGYGDSVFGGGVYHSKRRHRAKTEAVDGIPWGALRQSVAADAYRGRRVRLRGKVRADAGGAGRLWLRVETPKGVGFSDNMADRPIRATSWTDAEIIGTVDANAALITVGVIVTTGGASFDSITLDIEDPAGAWQPIALADPDFEGGDPTTSWQRGTDTDDGTLTGWTAAAEHDNPASGAAALHLAHQLQEVTDELFDDAPAAGEIAEVDLGGGLRARVPIALYSKDGHTLGDDPAAAARSQASPPAPSSSYDSVAGAADVVVAWNVLQHFWPYWNVVTIDWNAELDTALAEALADRTMDDHKATLQRLAAAAPDGHAGVRCPGTTQLEDPAVVLDWIEGQAVVAASDDARVKAGDVIAAIDARPTADVLADALTRLSGSPQWRHVIAMKTLLWGPKGTSVALRLRRDGAELDVTVPRVPSTDLQPLPVHAATEQLSGGVWYVDLSKISSAELDAALPKLAAAPAVIFDVRAYPGDGGEQILPHLLDHAEDAKWMSVAQIIRPDHAAATSQGFGWHLAPAEPHLGGRIAFLTGPGAISYAESVMGFVEGERLAMIVGEPTAGTNGNVAVMMEPTGCSTSFTGMRVTRHDGTRSHLIGIVPTITATRTIAGVRAGKDEVLDAALAALAEPAR
jgi:C-terminal processing protease CtpA/Prc